MAALHICARFLHVISCCNYFPLSYKRARVYRYVKDCLEDEDAKIEHNQRSWTCINPGNSDLWSCMALGVCFCR